MKRTIQWSTILPISTKRTITSQLKPLNRIKHYDMALEILVLSWVIRKKFYLYRIPLYSVCVQFRQILPFYFQSSFQKTGQWFSPDAPVSSTNKSDCHSITEILLKVALNTINQQLKSRLAKILIFRSVEYLKIQGR